jgi:hypothetical protein
MVRVVEIGGSDKEEEGRCLEKGYVVSLKTTYIEI